MIIRLISNKYKIKHGQKIKLYTAYSDDLAIHKSLSKFLLISNNDIKTVKNYYITLYYSLNIRQKSLP
jgi:hypothetical protein